jgi:long-subunit acyl-CoA synthetase (AMP-forming)
MFGGRLKSIGTGSASVSPHVLLFFCEALNITLGEGYGQT